MATKILFLLGSLILGGQSAAHQNWWGVACASCFLIGVLLSMKEYE